MTMYDDTWERATKKRDDKARCRHVEEETMHNHDDDVQWHHLMSSDQLNSRFHGHDIFREIGLLPWKMPICMKSVIFREFQRF